MAEELSLLSLLPMLVGANACWKLFSCPLLWLLELCGGGLWEGSGTGLWWTLIVFCVGGGEGGLLRNLTLGGHYIFLQKKCPIKNIYILEWFFNYAFKKMIFLMKNYLMEIKRPFNINYAFNAENNILKNLNELPSY